MSSNPNYEWKQLLDIDDFDLPLTPVLRPCNSHVRETITTTTTEVEETLVIISGPASTVLVEETPVIISGPAGTVLVDEKPVRTIPSPAVVEDVGADEDFKSGVWVIATEYVNANGGIVSGCLGDIKNFLKNGKLEQIVAIIKSCTPNALGDLTVTVKDLSGIIVGAIHHKVINEEGYGNDITVFHKDSVPCNGSGVGGSGMLMEEKEIVKLMEEKEMADLELQVCWNVTHQEMADEEALNVALEEEARQARADQE
ncbi:ribonuclease H-like domain-containing protein [Tanacetum coccineum]